MRFLYENMFCQKPVDKLGLVLHKIQFFGFTSLFIQAFYKIVFVVDYVERILAIIFHLLCCMGYLCVVWHDGDSLIRIRVVGIDFHAVEFVKVHAFHTLLCSVVCPIHSSSRWFVICVIRAYQSHISDALEEVHTVLIIFLWFVDSHVF